MPTVEKSELNRKARVWRAFATAPTWLLDHQAKRRVESLRARKEKSAQESDHLDLLDVPTVWRERLGETPGSESTGRHQEALERLRRYSERLLSQSSPQ